MVYYDLPPGPGPFSRTVATIGNFDGVHLGHRTILARASRRARELEAQAVALTFEPHPLKVLRPDTPLPLLTTPSHKIELLTQAGMEAVVVLPFTREFAALAARDFVCQYFLERLNVREVVVGHDYSFGRQRQGSIDLLQEMGRSYGFSVQVVWAVEVNGAVVSSSLIRAILRLGKVKEAGALLGRPGWIDVLHGGDGNWGEFALKHRATDWCRIDGQHYMEWMAERGFKLTLSLTIRP